MTIVLIVIAVYLAIGCTIGIAAVIAGLRYITHGQIYLIKVFFMWLFGWPYWTWKTFVSE